VLAITVGLLLILVVALGVMGAVALPHLLSGSGILAPGAKQAVGRATSQVKLKPVAAAGSTWHGLVATRRRLARAWAPVSLMLHEAMDRLEGRDAAAQAPAGIDSASAVTVSAERVNPAEAQAEPVAADSQVPNLPVTAYSQGFGVLDSEPAEAAPVEVEPVEVEPVRVSAVAPGMPSPMPSVKQDRFDVAAITRGRPVGRPRPVPTDSGPIPEYTGEARVDEAGQDRSSVIDLRDQAPHPGRKRQQERAGSGRRAH
jgi:hypothetical protein